MNPLAFGLGMTAFAYFGSISAPACFSASISASADARFGQHRA